MFAITIPYIRGLFRRTISISFYTNYTCWLKSLYTYSLATFSKIFGSWLILKIVDVLKFMMVYEDVLVYSVVKKHRLVIEVESLESSSKKITTRRREGGGVVVEKEIKSRRIFNKNYCD